MSIITSCDFKANSSQCLKIDSATSNKHPGTTTKAIITLKSNLQATKSATAFPFTMQTTKVLILLASHWLQWDLWRTRARLSGHGCKPLSFIGITITMFHVHAVTVASSGRQQYAFHSFSSHPL